MNQSVISKSTPVTIGVVLAILVFAGWLYTIKAEASEAKASSELNATKIEAIQDDIKEAPTLREVERIITAIEELQKDVKDILKKK